MFGYLTLRYRDGNAYGQTAEPFLPVRKLTAVGDNDRVSYIEDDPYKSVVWVTFKGGLLGRFINVDGFTISQERT